MESVNETQKKLPNAIATLVLGIFSVIFYRSFIGIIFGIVALAISSNSKKLYKKNPDDYSDYESLRIGRILSIIGIIVSVGFSIFFLIQFFNFRSGINPVNPVNPVFHFRFP